VARAAATAPPPRHSPRPPDLLLDGLAALYTLGYAAALPILRQALAAAEESTPADEEPHWLWLACIVASHVWDDERWELRKVEVYADGLHDWAEGERSTGTARLSDQALPSFEEIALQPEFTAREISREEFEAVWRKAKGNAP
jgi:hypothetical protein